jgi:hypothetical protein
MGHVPGEERVGGDAVLIHRPLEPRRHPRSAGAVVPHKLLGLLARRGVRGRCNGGSIL